MHVTVGHAKGSEKGGRMSAQATDATDKRCIASPNAAALATQSSTFSAGAEQALDPSATLSLANSNRIAIPHPSVPPQLSESQQLDAVIDTALAQLANQPGKLIRARVSGEHGFAVAKLVDYIGAFADVFATAESTLDGAWEHAHLVVLVPDRNAATSLVHAAAEHCGQSRHAQRIMKAVAGWTDFERGDPDLLGANLRDMWTYDLCIGAHAIKREKELPIAVIATGCLAPLKPLAAFALAEVHPGLIRRCEAPGCGKPLTSRRTGCRACNGSCRSAIARAKAASLVTKADISPSVAERGEAPSDATQVRISASAANDANAHPVEQAAASNPPPPGACVDMSASVASATRELVGEALMRGPSQTARGAR